MSSARLINKLPKFLGRGGAVSAASISSLYVGIIGRTCGEDDQTIMKSALFTAACAAPIGYGIGFFSGAALRMGCNAALKTGAPQAIFKQIKKL